MATLTHDQLEKLWISNGGNPIHADLAAAIAQAESGGCQYAHAGPTDNRPVKQCTYRNTNGEDSDGLWQINRRAHPQYSAASLYTLDGNARAAIAISSNGSNFRPWTTFVLGAYVQYLTGAPGGPQPGTTAPPPSGGSGGPTPLQGGPSTSLTGWNHLLRTIASGMPTAQHRVALLQRATLRELHTKRKVAK